MSQCGVVTGPLLARNTLLNFTGLLLAGVLTIVCTPVIVRGWGVEAYGIFAFSLSILGYLGFLDLGLARATTKFAAACLRENGAKSLRAVVSNAVGLQLLLGALGTVVFGAAVPVLVENVLRIPATLVTEARSTLLILAASLPAVLVTGALRGVLEAGQRFDLVNAVKVPSAAATYLVPAAGIQFGLRLPAVVFLLVIVRALAALAHLALSRKVFPSLRWRPSLNFNMLRTLLTYGSWITVSNVIGPLLAYLERFVLASFASMRAVAYYSAPYELVNGLLIVPASLVATLFPAFSSLSRSPADRREVKVLFARSVKFLLLVLGPLILMVALFAPEVLRLWLGAEYARRSALVLQILGVGVLINSLALVPYSLLQALGHPDLPAKFHLAELPIYVGLAVPLVAKFGAPGAALAWTVRVALDAALLFGACAWRGLVSVRSLAPGSLPRSVAAVLVLGLLLVLASAEGGWPRLLLALAAVGFFHAAAWACVLDSREREFVTAAAARVFARMKATARHA